MEHEPGKPWGTVEIAEKVGLADSRIRQLLIAGELQGFKIGKTWLVPDEVAKAFIAEKRSRWEKY